MTLDNKKFEVQPQYLADYEISFSEDDLNELDVKLSQEEGLKMKELLDLRDNAKIEGHLLKDMLEAAKQGALNYLNSFTDTGDTFTELKNPEDVRKWNDTEINIKDNSATPHAPLEGRTMGEARTNPFDKNVSGGTAGMSESGAKKFEHYKEAYSQRTKSITKLSTDDSTINRSDSKQNFESLSGLRGYRVGPVVEMPTVAEAKKDYEAYKTRKIENGTESSTLPESTWLYNENMKTFDKKLMDEFGFKTQSEAAAWRKENHLTVHEGPDGMFLVPRDIHDKVSHNGYRTKMTEALQGKITQEELDTYVRQEKIEFAKHEAKTRSIRAVKGIGMSIVRDLLKSFICIVGEEAYNEFTRESKDNLVDRVKRLIKQTWEHLKKKCNNILKNLWNTIKSNAAGALVSELFTLINDFFLKTAKNIFKIIRTMWKSIYNALKVIFSNKSTWGERIFEAIKILTSGFVGVIGFSLNEMIDKALMTIGIPFSSFIAECLSGLFAGVMSSIVLVIFDNIKGSLFATSPYLELSRMEAQLVAIDSARISISSIRTSTDVKETYGFIGEAVAGMNAYRQDTIKNQAKSQQNIEDIKNEASLQDKNLTSLSELSSKYAKDDNF